MTTAPQTLTQEETDLLKEFGFLNNADRSDAYASGAVQALVRVAKGRQDLLFDKHSFDKHEAALIGAGWQVVEDVREAVLNPPKTAYDTSDH